MCRPEQGDSHKGIASMWQIKLYGMALMHAY